MQDKILEVEHLKKQYTVKKLSVDILKDVSFSLRKNSCLAITGESGSGKTTIAKILMHLVPFQEGRIFFEGEDITRLTKKNKKMLSQVFQMVFQDTFQSLDPKMNVFRLISEPLRHYKVVCKKEIKNRVCELLDSVELPSSCIKLYPFELNGGARQRVCIARAISCNPKVLIFDEAVSSLDPHTQRQILDLIRDLKHSASIIFISHDVQAVEYIADGVVELRSGKMLKMPLLG